MLDQSFWKHDPLSLICHVGELTIQESRASPSRLMTAPTQRFLPPIFRPRLGLHDDGGAVDAQMIQQVGGPMRDRPDSVRQVGRAAARGDEGALRVRGCKPGLSLANQRTKGIQGGRFLAELVDDDLVPTTNAPMAPLPQRQ
jgi:hypothetical protein